jgi:hypothetical protein
VLLQSTAITETSEPGQSERVAFAKIPFGPRLL